MSDPRKDAEFEDQHESVAAGDVPDMGNTLRCPECDTKMVRCDEDGVNRCDWCDALAKASGEGK